MVLVLLPFQDYFIYFEPFVNQRWTQTGVPEENTPDLPLKDLVSKMWPESYILYYTTRLQAINALARLHRSAAAPKNSLLACDVRILITWTGLIT